MPLKYGNVLYEISNPPFSQINPIRLYLLPKDYTYEKLKSFLISKLVGPNNEQNFPLQFPEAQYLEHETIINDIDIEGE